MLPGVVDGPTPRRVRRMVTVDSLCSGHQQALRVLPGVVDGPDPAEFGGGCRRGGRDQAVVQRVQLHPGRQQLSLIQMYRLTGRGGSADGEGFWAQDSLRSGAAALY